MAIQGPNFIMPKSYRKIGLSFLVLSILALVSVFYISGSKVLITIHSNTIKVNQDFVFNIKNQPPADSLDTITGKVITATVEETKIFKATGTKEATATVSDVVGEVTITNNYNKEQVLVEKTRLANIADPKKVIARIKNTITIPAGQQVKVKVYTENPAEFVDVLPGKLIIPGLWQGLWDKIYAENSQNLSLNSQGIVYVQESDITEAKKQFEEELYQKALVEINNKLDQKESLWPRIASSKIIESTPSAQIGDEITEFNLKVKIEAVAVIFDESQLITLAENKIKQSLSDDKKLIDLDPKSFIYNLENYNPDTNEAVIKVTSAGNSAVTQNSKLFDKSKLTGKTALEIKNYFSQFPEVKSIDVNFQPVWANRTPTVAEKILVQMSDY